MTLHERAEQLWNSLEEGNGTCFEESDKLLIESALREVVEECATKALEQRCERVTAWDRACLAIATAIRGLNQR